MNGTICFKTLDNLLWTAIRGMKTGTQQENVNIHNNTEDQQKNNRSTNIHIAIIFEKRVEINSLVSIGSTFCMNMSLLTDLNSSQIVKSKGCFKIEKECNDVMPKGYIL